jgi:hypothetical protein
MILKQPSGEFVLKSVLLFWSGEMVGRCRQDLPLEYTIAWEKPTRRGVWKGTGKLDRQYLVSVGNQRCEPC